MNNKIKIILGVCLISGVVIAASITKFYGDIDMQSHKITNLATPTSNNDATSKTYVDTQIHTRLNKQGGQLTGTLDMQTNYIIRVRKPRSGSNGKMDATNRDYVDGATNNVRNYVNSTFLPLGGGTMIGDINMSGYAIHNLRTPVGNNDAATRGYVDSVINNANAYQYFALKKGSGFTPIYNLDSNTDRWFDVKVVRQFDGAITSYYENIRAVATPNFPNKTWKVGETVKVLFSLVPETFSETNGTLVIKGGSGVLGNFGITAPPNGTSPFTCDLIVNGTTYAPDTSLSLNNIWDNGNKCFTFKLKNTSGRTISNATITAPSVIQYVSSTPYTSTHLYFADPGTYTTIPGTLTISSWANNMELTFKLYVIDIDNDYGFRWDFNISADGQSYDFGQFFYYIP